MREAIKSGASNLKERLFIQLEPDKGANTQYLRKGHVQFDKYNFTSRLLAPEIEKEVKRLLRVDYEAVSVKWEVITEEELNSNKGGEAGQSNPDVKPSASGDFTNDPKDLGLDLSDSEDEGRHGVDMDSDENSRMSATADDSR